MTFDPSSGVMLRFHGVTVKLFGRNLATVGDASVSLLDALHRHRFVWVQEVDDLRGWNYPEGMTVITKVEILVSR